MRPPFRIALLLVACCVALAGCGGKKIEFADMKGYGDNAPGNLVHQAHGFALSDDGLYFVCNSSVYRMDTQTGQVEINCIDPACNHGPNSTCKARLLGLSSALFSANDKVYLTDSMISDVLVEFSLYSSRYIPLKSVKTSICSQMFDGKLYSYRDDPRSLTIFDLDTATLEKNISLDQEITQFTITQGTVYFTTSNMELYELDLKQEKPEALPVEKVENVLMIEDQFYYISFENEQALCRMDLNGEKQQILIPGVKSFNQADEKLYYIKKDQAGVFVSELDGQGEQLLLPDAQVETIFVFQDYDQIVASSILNDSFYTVGRDGSNPVLHEGYQIEQVY